MSENIRGASTIDENAAAEFLGLNVRTLQTWRQKCTGPRYIKYSSRAVRYRVADLIEFQEQYAVATVAKRADTIPSHRAKPETNGRAVV